MRRVLLVVAVVIAFGVGACGQSTDTGSRRAACGTFCQQAGPSGGGGPPPLLLTAVRISSRPIRVVDGVAPVRVSCRFTPAMEPLLIGATVARGCVGALYIADGEVVYRHGGGVNPTLHALVVGAVNLDVPSGRTETIDVSLTRTERKDLKRMHRLTVEVGVELKGRIYVDDPDHPGHRVLATETHLHVRNVETTLLG